MKTLHDTRARQPQVDDLASSRVNRDVEDHSPSVSIDEEQQINFKGHSYVLACKNSLVMLSERVSWLSNPRRLSKSTSLFEVDSSDVDTYPTTTCSKKWTQRWRGINCAYDEGRARLSRLRASSPKRLARVRTHSPLAPPCREGNVMVMLRCRRSESPRRVSTRSHQYRATIPSTRARNPREVATRFSSLEEATYHDKSFSRSHLPPSLSRRTAPHSIYLSFSWLLSTTNSSILHRI